ncbi:hypothetical protein BD289DRAFT_343489, partial [Coniella lustricola]
RRRKHRQALSSPEALSNVPRSRKRRSSGHTAASGGSWFVDYPDKVSKADLTREQQVSLVKHLRPSVILDAASEAFWQGQSINTIPDSEPPLAILSSRRGSLDSRTDAMAKYEFSSNESIRKSLYDSFRWLDEEESLDLGLFLDDYHANLRNDVSLTDKAKQPTYRRRMSANRLPFGRPPSSIRDRGHGPSPLSSHPIDMTFINNHHNNNYNNNNNNNNNVNSNNLHRRLSLSLSLMSPAKASFSDHASVIDPCATYYQDPEARKKLRAYLASPGKFDEAIQFGFAATDSAAAAPSPPQLPLAAKPRRRPSRLRLRSDDDDAELSDKDDDASSVSDPESPRTPQLAGLAPPPVPVKYHKTAQSYSHFPNRNTSREMTLKMTLTRPDLRADEELIYGWKKQMQA